MPRVLGSCHHHGPAGTLKHGVTHVVCKLQWFFNKTVVQAHDG
jgi:hypothetical protein